MEFIRVLNDLFESDNVNDIKDTNKLINCFVAAVKSEDDSVKFHQLNYLLSLSKTGNFIYKIYNAHKKKYNVAHVIAEVIHEYDYIEISPVVYSYFIYCTLKALKIQVEDLHWISPFVNTLRNSSNGMVPSFGHGYYMEDIYDYEIARNVIVRCLKDKKYMTIPNKITKIEEDAFKTITSMEFLTLPESLVELTANNFSEAPELGRIIIANKVKVIPDHFLRDAHKLFVVVARGITEIGESAFEATRLGTIRNIGANRLESIGTNAFKDCFQLKKLEFSNLKKIGTTPFYNCINTTEISLSITEELIKNKFQIHKLFEKNSLDMNNYTNFETITIESKDGILPAGLFENCSTVKNIKILGEIKEIGPNAFKGCTSLENLVLDFKGSILSNSLFEGCTSLSTFPKFTNVEQIHKEVFKDCNLLEEVIFFKPITKLLDGAFKNCVNLKKIAIRLLTDVLPKYCFSGCTAITDFTFLNNIRTIESYSLQGLEISETLLASPKLTSIDAFAFDSCKFENTIIIPNECTIEENAFSNIAPVNKIIINNLVIEDKDDNQVEFFKIFEETFDKFITKFSTIKELEINSDTVIKKSFKNWKQLETIQFGDKVNIIEESSFEGCSGLQNVHFASKNLQIKEAAFKDCTNLSKITTNDKTISDTKYIYDLSVCTRIEENAFNNCNCEEIYLTIGKDTFEDAFSLSKIFTKNIKSDYILKTVNIDSKDNLLKSNVFQNCTTITNINVSGVINDISDSMFSGCSNLENLDMTFEGNLISNLCFENCVKLVEFPEFPNVKIIADKAFLGCTAMSSVKFLKRIDEIGESAFEGCSSLKDIEMDFYGKQLNANTFKGCNDINNFEFIKSVEVFESYSLSNLNLVNKFVMPDNVLVVKNNAFDGSTLNEELILNSDVTYQKESFANVKGINSIMFNNLIFTNVNEELLPYSLFCKTIELFNKKYDSIKTITINTNNISNSAFKGWKNLSNIIFTHKVESLPLSCFEDCVSIEKISLPYFNISLGEKVFANCINLSKIIYENNMIEENKINNLPINVYSNCKKLEEICIYLNQHILDSEFKLYSYFAENEELFHKNLPKLKSVSVLNEIKEIPKSFFKNCRRLTNIKILNEINVINQSAFEDCILLEQIEANFTGEQLSEKVFSGCINLVNIFNYDSVEVIKEKAFSNCKSLEILSFSKDIVELGKNGFENCLNLTDIEMKFIGEKFEKEIFLNCKKLLRTPKFTNLEYLDVTSFSGCISLKTLYLTALKNSDFYNLFSSLKTIEKVYYNSFDIPNNFFNNVSNVEEIIFEQKLKSIGDNAFENCTNIATINNLDELEYIGDRAFKNSNLTNISIPTTILSYGSGIFSNCFNLTEINIPIRFDFIGSIFSGTENTNSKEIIQIAFGIERSFFMPQSLKKITINSGEIVDGAFSNLDVELVIDLKLSKVKDYTFYNCTNVVLPYMNEIKDIGDFAFANTKMEHLELNSILSLGMSAFKGAEIKHMVVGEKINVMNASTFENFKFENLEIKNNKYFKLESNLIIDIKKTIILNVFDCDEELIIPAEISILESDTFVNKNIKSVDTNNVKTIKTNAFVNCTLEKVIFRKVEKFSQSVISNCTNITHLELPFIGADIKTVKSIDFLFDFEKQDFDNITINNGSFTPNTFKNIRNIKTLDLLYVKKNLFEENLFKNMIIDKLVLPKTLEDIKDNAFNNVTVNEVICDDDSIVKYNENCIYVDNKISYCTKNHIDNLIIDENIIEISKNAFKNVETINYIEITNDEIAYSGLLDQVRSVNKLTICSLDEKLHQLFKKSINEIEDITYLDKEVPKDFFKNIISFKKLTFTNNIDFNISMFTSEKEKLNLLKAKKMVIDQLIFEQDLKEFDDSIFQYITLNNLDIKPNELYSTDDNLLYDLKNKTLLYACKAVSGQRLIPQFINYTKEEAFKNCNELTAVKFVYAINIGRATFENCSKLDTLVINKSCEEIGETILRKCDNFKHIELPYVGKNINDTKNLDYLFGVDEINKVIETIKITNQSIVEGTFNRHSNIGNVILGYGVNEVKGHSFEGCKKLEKVYLNPDLVIVEPGAFNGCTRSLKVFVNKKMQKTWAVGWDKIDEKKKMFSTLKVVHKKFKQDIYS